MRVISYGVRSSSIADPSWSSDCIQLDLAANDIKYCMVPTQLHSRPHTAIDTVDGAGQHKQRRPRSCQIVSAGISETEHLNHAQVRVATFTNWPEDERIDRRQLAEAGFYFSGTETGVKCFSCLRTINNWKCNDIAIRRHKELNPDCPFIKEQSNNIPLNHSNNNLEVHSQNITNGSMANGTSPSRMSSSIQERRSSIEMAIPDCTRYPSPLVKEDERLKTFEDWPHSFIKPTDLAKAGFYYLKVQDIVQCMFCKGIVGEWEVGDVPMDDHKKHFPWCPFIRNVNVGNVPIASRRTVATNHFLNEHIAEMLTHSEEYGNGDVTGIYKTDRRPSLRKSIGGERYLAKIGINEHTPPAHLRYKSLESRLGSFHNWPKTNLQSPTSLAEAGFFYYGIADDVRCFFFNGGLRKWEATDDPWIEHAKCNGVEEMNSEASSSKLHQLPPTPEEMEEDRNSPLPVDLPPPQPSSKKSNEDKPTTTPDEMTLKVENEQLKEMSLCKVCLVQEVGVVFLPCGHFACCPDCAIGLNDCPICRKRIRGVVRIFLA